MAENAVKQNKVKNSRIFGDYLIMLVAPLVIAVWYYGARAVYAAAAAVAGAMITDIAANLIIRKQYRLKDLSSVYIGAAIAAMMPAESRCISPLWLRRLPCLRSRYRSAAG